MSCGVKTQQNFLGRDITMNKIVRGIKKIPELKALYVLNKVFTWKNQYHEDEVHSKWYTQLVGVHTSYSNIFNYYQIKSGY